MSTIRREAVAVRAKIVSAAVAIAALKISTIFTTRTYTIMDLLQNDAGVEGEWILARRIDLVSCYIATVNANTTSQIFMDISYCKWTMFWIWTIFSVDNIKLIKCKDSLNTHRPNIPKAFNMK